MKFKLDENFGPSIQKIFLDRDFDAETVPQENLSGADDPTVLTQAQNEGRALVTMDSDFSNTFCYPPEEYQGIVVVRPHTRVTFNLLRGLINSFLDRIDRFESGKLWIVEPGRIREHGD